MSEQWASPELVASVVQRTTDWLDEAITSAETTLSTLHDIRAGVVAFNGNTVALDEVPNMERTCEEVKEIAIAVSHTRDRAGSLTYGWR